MPKVVTSLFFLIFFLSCRQEIQKPYAGGELRIGIFHKPSIINPITTDSTFSANLLDLTFNTLIRFGGDGVAHPELAESWELSPDGLVWTFRLRKNVRFHDGTPLTAADVKFTYDRLLASEGGGYSQYLWFVKTIEVVDPYTLRIFCAKTDSTLWMGLSLFGIAPHHLLENDPQYEKFNRHPVGSGPYRFVKQDSEEIILEANEDYFGGRPFLNRIVIRILPGQEANLIHMIAGDIDMMFLLNPKDYGALIQIPSIRIYDNWYPLLYMISFNMKNSIFSSPIVREALNFAVDREKILQKVLQGKGRPAALSVSQEDANYNPEAGPYPYDPRRAVQILRQAGWASRDDSNILMKNGHEFRFVADTIEGEDLNTEILQMLQQQLREIGVRMEVKFHTFGDYVKKVFRKKDFDAGISYFVFHPFCDNNFSLWHSSQIANGLNFTSYRNARVDHLLETARLSLDPKIKTEALKEFQKTIHSDPPGIFLFWRNMPIAVRKRFKGFPEKKMESLRDLVHVWDAGESS